MLDVSLIGTGGMMPLHNRYLSSAALRYNGGVTLFDCGEGTQMTLKLLGWGFKAIELICVTHFHADHISGLPGLLLAIGNSGREERLTMAGPPGLERVVNGLRVIAPDLPFEIGFLEIPPAKTPARFRLGGFRLSALGLDHRGDCLGYTVEIDRAGKFDPERAKGLEIPLKLWSRLQRGETVDGYTPDMVLGPARKGIKFAFVTDTRPAARIADFVRGADLFICEGLYGDRELSEKAAKHKHMTFFEAARLARAGEVRELWLTHFSPAMPDPRNYVKVAKAIFGNAKTGFDRMTTTILFEE